MEGQQPEKSNVFEDPNDAGQTANAEPDRSHVHDITQTATAHRYRMYDQSSTVVCDDCGCLVFDTGRHDNFHLMVEAR